MRAAVIGCGRIGSLLEEDRLRSHPCTHAGIWAAHDRTELIGGCDRNPERLEAFGKRWGLPDSALFEDPRDLFSALEPEIVSVATYTESHADIVIAAARAGAKIILDEKPMAMTLEECDRMIEVCRETGALLAVHHERRWSRAARTTRRLIEEGVIGGMRTIVGRVLTGPPRPGSWHSKVENSGGGPMLHDGTHLVDIVRYYAGDILTVEGRIERRTPGITVEDRAWATMTTSSGAIVFIEGGGRRGYFEFTVDIQGSKGRILNGNSVLKLFTTGRSPRYEGFTELLEVPFPRDEIPSWYPAIVDDLLAAHEEGRPPASTGEDGRAALEAVFAIYESARSGERLELPLSIVGNPLYGVFSDEP